MSLGNSASQLSKEVILMVKKKNKQIFSWILKRTNKQ